MSALEVDRDEAERFLAALDPNTDRFTFQTFDDDHDRKDKRLANIFHGTLTQHFDKLAKLNAQGAGIFVTINITDLKGRTISNMLGVRAIFIDLDGAPLYPVYTNGSPEPNIITETSPGRWHAYWRVADMPLGEFGAMQRSLAMRFNGDASIIDLTRVMRIPGFIHRKSEPFLSRLYADDAEPYDYATLREAFDHVEPPPPPPPPPPSRDDMPEQWRRLNSAALANLSAWVPRLFPGAKPYHEGYRVSSKNLARNLEEDLSFRASGIVDWGVHDMGDPRQGRRSPIDVVKEHRYTDFAGAVRMLCEALGFDPRDYEPRGRTGPEPPPPEPQPEPGPQPKWPWRFFGREEEIVERSYLVRKLLPETGVGLISGQWGTYKSFVALDLAAAVITQTAFAGFEIARQGAVLFVALEAQDEVEIRMRAALAHRGYLQALAPFAWIDICPRLLDQDAGKVLANMVKEVAERLQHDFGLSVALVIVDTAGKAAGYLKSGDENDAVLGRQIIMALAEASRSTGALFLGVEHFGKAAETGTRGSSAKESDCDAVLALLGDKSISGEITNPRLAIRKRRSGSNGVEVPFQPKIVPAGDDETTLVIDWLANQTATTANKSEKDNWSKSLRLFRKIIMSMLSEHGTMQRPFPDETIETLTVEVEVVRKEFYASHVADGDDKQKAAARRQAFNRCVKDAQGRGLIKVRVIDGVSYLWLAVPGEVS